MALGFVTQREHRQPAAVAVLVGNQFARWLGLASAAGNSLAQMLRIQAYPGWSLALRSPDILAICALMVDGGRIYRRV